MKSKRIPEHKLNVTTTVDQALENMTNNKSSNVISSEAQITKSTQVHSKEVK